jgi:hypothetical protein
MPALLKDFFEQALRPGFAMALIRNGGWSKLLAGRSCARGDDDGHARRRVGGTSARMG